MVKTTEDGSRLLRILDPIISVLPEVPQASQRMSFKERVIWIVLIFLIFLGFSQLPLIGIAKDLGPDPFFWMRSIMASKRGSQMDLGISPLLTANMFMQLLASLKLLRIDLKDTEQKQLFEGAKKVVTIFISIFQAITFTAIGLYGPLQELSKFRFFLIVGQLIFSSLIILLLDDLIFKGYGIGNNGSSVFMTITVTMTAIWAVFSPFRFTTPSGSLEFEGLFFAIFGVFFAQDKVQSLTRLFIRSELPNLVNLAATVGIFLTTLFLQSYKVKLELSNSMNAAKVPYEISLFYSGSMPILLLTALVNSVYSFSLFVARQLPYQIVVKVLGSWQTSGQKVIPRSGLAYFVSPPMQLQEILLEPLHTVVYILFVIITCYLFSNSFIEFSNQNPYQIATVLKNQGYFITGMRNQGTEGRLRKYIPIATSLGGILLGGLSVGADFLGAIGSGTGLMLSTMVISGVTQQIRKQKQQMNLASLFK